MSNFQIALIALFIGIFGFAVLVFSGIIKIGRGSTQTASGDVLVWGTYSETAMTAYLSDFSRRDKEYNISYVQIAPENFDQAFIEALASGVGPDIILVGNDSFLRHQDKLFIIPYTSYPERTFRDTYLDGSYLYLTRAGIIGVPVTVDPLVLYYNKNLLARDGIITPPSTWEDLARMSPLIVGKSKQGGLETTTIALGEYANIPHFKHILSALFLQAGNGIVAEDRLSNGYASVLQNTAPNGGTAADALRFYLSFANPVNELYTWNRSLPSARDAFIGGTSAFYIGSASELFDIQSQNPNLNFDVALLPQPETNEQAVTYGTFTAASVVKSTKNFSAAYAALLEFGSDTFATFMSKTLSVPPAHRALLLDRPQSPYLNVFFSTAAVTFSWPDPDIAKTDQAFRDMIRNVSSGRTTPEEAVSEASKALQSAIRR
ncbi:MAG TPA: extracellular solute-binding protein [Candidatus Paceibacterota bacterium]|nr:extracellular solute-binding protein [Candidatus Paceibacterota bacterium]